MSAHSSAKRSAACRTKKASDNYYDRIAQGAVGKDGIGTPPPTQRLADGTRRWEFPSKR